MIKEITTKISIFQRKEIRKIIHKNEWWFSVADVIKALTDTIDVRDYIKKMRKRDDELNSYWGTNCPLLEMTAKDGKKRKITSANTEGIFRIIQSIEAHEEGNTRPFAIVRCPNHQQALG
jgi:DNA-damage-inducible protein D